LVEKELMLGSEKAFHRYFSVFILLFIGQSLSHLLHSLLLKKSNPFCPII